MAQSLFAKLDNHMKKKIPSPCDLNEHMQPPLFAFYSYADNPTGVKQQQEDEKKKQTHSASSPSLTTKQATLRT